MAYHIIARQYLDTNLHEVITGIYLVIARQPRLAAWHQAHFLDAILGIGIQTLQPCWQQVLVVAWMDVISQYYSMAFVLVHTLENAVVALIRRYQTIEVWAVEYRFQTIVFLDGVLTILLVLVADFLHTDIEAQLASEGYIHTELDAGSTVPFCDMGAHCLRWHEVGEAPLDEKAFYGVSIVTAPIFSEVFQSFVVASTATARAKHHAKFWIVGMDTIENFI